MKNRLVRLLEQEVILFEVEHLVHYYGSNGTRTPIFLAITSKCFEKFLFIIDETICT
jgi:hypothetical protein